MLVKIILSLFVIIEFFLLRKYIKKCKILEKGKYLLNNRYRKLSESYDKIVLDREKKTNLINRYKENLSGLNKKVLLLKSKLDNR